MNILALAKLLFLTKGIFPGKASTDFSIFLNQNILFLECPKRARTYIWIYLNIFEYILRIKIKNKCENEDSLELYVEWNNNSYAAHKDDFFNKLLTWRYIFQLVKYKNKGVSEAIDSDDRNLFSVGLAE